MALACGRPDCAVSSDPFETLTFGRGDLDDLGYWSEPCSPCARLWETEHPGEVCWPPADADPRAGAGG